MEERKTLEQLEKMKEERVKSVHESIDILINEYVTNLDFMMETDKIYINLKAINKINIMIDECLDADEYMVNGIIDD